MSLAALLDTLPEVAKDTRLNVSSVLSSSSLTPAQRWGVALASAVASRNPAVRDAVLAEARAALDEGAAGPVLEDALAAASLMAMNNVYYRFRHLVGKATYSERPARLRMNRLVKPSTNKVDFELFCLAVSAINACETCIRSHEEVVVRGGLSEEQVHDAVRIAAVVNALAVSLELPSPTLAAQAA